jgi:phage baseplate assembly protein W
MVSTASFTGRGFLSTVFLSNVDDMNTERNQFLRLLQAHFDGDELEELCFQLNVEPDDLSGSTRSAKMRALLLHCERHGISRDLYNVCQRLRENVTWPLLETHSPDNTLELNLDQKSTTVILGDRIDMLAAQTNDGNPAQWRSIADKNKLKNPRILQPGQTLAPDTLLGSGWSFPLQISAQGGVTISHDKKGLNESITILLMTSPGERLMHPDYGCRLNELCFMLNDKKTLTLTQTYITEALQKWETRITLLTIDAIYSPNSPYAILITIAYKIKATDENGEIQFVFHLMWNMSSDNQNNLKVWDGSHDNIF